MMITRDLIFISTSEEIALPYHSAPLFSSWKRLFLTRPYYWWQWSPKCHAFHLSHPLPYPRLFYQFFLWVWLCFHNHDLPQTYSNFGEKVCLYCQSFKQFQSAFCEHYWSLLAKTLLYPCCRNLYYLNYWTKLNPF